MKKLLWWLFKLNVWLSITLHYEEKHTKCQSLYLFSKQGKEYRLILEESNDESSPSK